MWGEDSCRSAWCVTGTQGQAIHSWPTCRREYKLMCVLTTVLGEGKLNVHVQLPASVFFHPHGYFLHYLSTLNTSNKTHRYNAGSHLPDFQAEATCAAPSWVGRELEAAPSAAPHGGSRAEDPQQGSGQPLRHPLLLASQPKPGNNGAELPRHQGERSWHPTDPPDLGADPTASPALSQKQVFSCPPSPFATLARGAWEGLLPQNSPFSFFFFFYLFFFFFPHKKERDYGKLTRLVYGSRVGETVSICAQVIVGFHSRCFYPWNWSCHVFRDTCIFCKAGGLGKVSALLKYLGLGELNQATDWEKRKKKAENINM